ncbi:hypothetical protein BDF22DRAFT_666474 [Syncephalis plumigaleata]|nr:hypothetical protein BDF22DRAFT_666474 [Syncephalis plumigaleata]
MWNAAHLVTTIEHYEQCVDLNISGGGGGSSAPPTETKKNDGDTPAPASPPNGPAAPSTPASGGSCNDGEFKCNGNKIGQCAHKSFVWTTCPSGTQCRGSGNAIYCGF